MNLRVPMASKEPPNLSLEPERLLRRGSLSSLKLVGRAAQLRTRRQENHLRRGLLTIVAFVVFLGSCSRSLKWMCFEGSLAPDREGCRVVSGSQIVFEVEVSRGVALIPRFERGYRAVVAVPKDRLRSMQRLTLGESGVVGVACPTSRGEIGTPEPLSGELLVEEAKEWSYVLTYKLQGMKPEIAFSGTSEFALLPLSEQ